jgi:hypothetical protein
VLARQPIIARAAKKKLRETATTMGITSAAAARLLDPKAERKAARKAVRKGKGGADGADGADGGARGGGKGRGSAFDKEMRPIELGTKRGHHAFKSKTRYKRR